MCGGGGGRFVGQRFVVSPWTVRRTRLSSQAAAVVAHYSLVKTLRHGIVSADFLVVTQLLRAARLGGVGGWLCVTDYITLLV